MNRSNYKYKYISALNKWIIKNEIQKSQSNWNKNYNYIKKVWKKSNLVLVVSREFQTHTSMCRIEWCTSFETDALDLRWCVNSIGAFALEDVHHSMRHIDVCVRKSLFVRGYFGSLCFDKMILDTQNRAV